jgi:hypothetical protein
MTVWSSHNIKDLISHKALNSISPSRVQILHSFLLQPDLLVLPEQQIQAILTALPQVFHSNPPSLLHFIKTHIVPNSSFHKTLKEISSSCPIYYKTNPLSNIWPLGKRSLAWVRLANGLY